MDSIGQKYSNIDITSEDALIQKVIKHQRNNIDEIAKTSKEVHIKADDAIASSEHLLNSLEKELPKRNKIKYENASKVASIRSWDEITDEANTAIIDEVAITDLLSNSEIIEIEYKIQRLRSEFDLEHKMDSLDYAIAGIAGILAALVDIFLVKMPSSKKILGATGKKGGTLSDFFRNHLKNKFTPEEIKALEVNNWVPYDASTSKNLDKAVAGLGPRSHRFQSLGHDPILGFIFGVKDIMSGTMTSIGSDGLLSVQKISGADGMSFFQAIIRQIGHLKSDIGTSAGLPVPFMPLLGLIQLGSFGKKGRTVGELARAMYGQGYDFGHFLAMSVPVMLIEVLVRVFYFAKRLNEGHSFLESLPVNIPGKKRQPKLQSMLFTAHTIATAANAGKVYFTQNPLSINFPQWLWFFKSSIHQLKWIAWDKENERFDHTQKSLDQDWDQVNKALINEWTFVDNPISFEQ